MFFFNFLFTFCGVTDLIPSNDFIMMYAAIAATEIAKTRPLIITTFFHRLLEEPMVT